MQKAVQLDRIRYRAVEDELCSICQDTLLQRHPTQHNIVRTPCNHFFHSNCILVSCIHHNRQSCPMCQMPMDVQANINLLQFKGADVELKIQILTDDGVKDDLVPFITRHRTFLNYASNVKRIPLRLQDRQLQMQHTALTAAIFQSNAAYVRALLEAHANPNEYKSYSRLLNEQPDTLSYELTPLMLACNRNSSESVRLLLHHNANIEASWGGMTAVQFAVHGNSSECLRLLLDRNALTPPSEDGRNLLHEAARLDHLECVRVLVSRFNLNLQDRRGFTPLHLAVDKGHVHIVKELIETRADASLATKTGETALILSVTGKICNPICLRLLWKVLNPTQETREQLEEMVKQNLASISTFIEKNLGETRRRRFANRLTNIQEFFKDLKEKDLKDLKDLKDSEDPSPWRTKERRSLYQSIQKRSGDILQRILKVLGASSLDEVSSDLAYTDEQLNRVQEILDEMIVKVLVQGIFGERMYFICKTTTLFSKVFVAFAQNMGYPRNEFEIHVKHEDPRDVDLEDLAYTIVPPIRARKIVEEDNVNSIVGERHWKKGELVVLRCEFGRR